MSYIGPFASREQFLNMDGFEETIFSVCEISFAWNDVRHLIQDYAETQEVPNGADASLVDVELSDAVNP